MTEHLITDEELHAFIDGELDAEQTRRIAAAIDASPALAAQIAGYRADKDLIFSIYGPLIEQPLPAALLQPFTKIRQRRVLSWPSFFVPALAAATVLLVAGWLMYPSILGLNGDPLVADALAAQSGRVAPERDLPPDAVATETTRDQIAAATLAAPVKVPNLEKAGYTLTGLTVFPEGTAGHALQARYRNEAGQTFTVYMRRSAGPDRFDLERRGKVQICVWQNDDLSVVMTSEMSAKDMLKVANLTYSDLNF